MKIVVTAKGAEPETELDPRFGRAAYLLLFDTEIGLWQSIGNAASQTAVQGAGIQTAEAVCKQGAEVVISGYVGPKALAVLSADGVRVFSSSTLTALEALQAFRRGELKEQQDFRGV
jgi:predicted Fe-Mo cluster-binding NifX family protein